MESLLATGFLFCAVPLSVFLSRKSRTIGLVEAKSVAALPFSRPNRYYPSNRPPLTVSPLVKLPIGAIEPRGWLLSQLKLMRDGLPGRLPEISGFLKDESGWLTLKGKGWEEAPYWLRGYGDLGFILKDQRIIKTTEKWLSSVFKSQQRDGYFGPPDNKSRNDLWPNMVMLFVLRSYHESTGDRRVLSFMSRYFQYQFHLPVEELVPGDWQKFRGGENLESVFWLYNRTGESYLLDLARRLFDRTADWTSPILTATRDGNWEESSFYHGVNIAMGFRQPAVYYQFSKDDSLLDAVEGNYREIMSVYGQQPGGMFGADENIRPGERDPRQGAETCTMVEFMASFQSLLRITGDPVWADRCEEIAFNSLPAAVAPDWNSLHYLTAPNMISCDDTDDHNFQNTGKLVAYDPWSYRCCQHNITAGWPYFVEHLWMATADNGLAAVLYSPSTVSAILEESARVLIAETTDYPFDGHVNLTISLDRPSEFPLYLRIPGWAETARIWINGAELRGPFPGGKFALIRKSWRHGDQVRLEFPMETRLKTWDMAEKPVSIRRGPLWYSLRIGEEWRRIGGTEVWPAFEVVPTTPWNYGLVVKSRTPDDSVRHLCRNPLEYQPFEPDSAPLVLSARGKKLGGWRAEERMVGKIPQSPVTARGKVEKIELIPMGCARLRISSFPTVKTASARSPVKKKAPRKRPTGSRK